MSEDKEHNSWTVGWKKNYNQRNISKKVQKGPKEQSYWLICNLDDHGVATDAFFQLFSPITTIKRKEPVISVTSTFIINKRWPVLAM